MDGCLFGCFKLIAQLILCLFLFALAPYAIILMLIWWPIALILGLIFPGHDFFPFKRIWSGSKDWMQTHLGLDIESILLLTLLFLVGGSIIGAIGSLFRKN